ncbi:hypothetical protein C7999DRAFT_14304 [Corynascus novoguineensis]|uniref:Uncharacterized protein n=1 Tax=Corynascus novoguineensis TaxID=1126955 RepID=A0AAN7HNW4_9PEZI|nr:hypothetical protein C7999DRAFT_14304 [Corynascus novoguineensis]
MLGGWLSSDVPRIAPLDSSPESEYPTLATKYHLPEEFHFERVQGVTHSFGHLLGGDGSETLWMHFLVELPQKDRPNEQPNWLHWGFVMTWLPKIVRTASTSTTSQSNKKYSVALIAFQPPFEMFQRIFNFVRFANWADVTVDPYVLVDLALMSWYHRFDQVAWEVTALVRTEEIDVFRRARLLRSAESSIEGLDLHRLHTSAKDAIFMLEGLDAAIRLAEAAMSAHEWSRQRDETVSENTHRLLRHRLELFHSTRLRMVSCQARIKNSVDLAFHINTAHDSLVNLRNSRSVRTISIVGMVFIPFGAITGVFGTQFFTPQAHGQHMDVNPDLWVLFAIAIPVTLFIMAIWQVSEHDHLKLWRLDPFGPALVRWREARSRVFGRGAKGDGGDALEATELQNLPPALTV